MASQTKLNYIDMSEYFGEILQTLSSMSKETTKLRDEAVDYNKSLQDDIMQRIINTLDEIAMTVEDIGKALDRYTEAKKQGTDGMISLYERVGANIKAIKGGRR